MSLIFKNYYRSALQLGPQVDSGLICFESLTDDCVLLRSLCVFFNGMNRYYWMGKLHSTLIGFSVVADISVFIMSFPWCNSEIEKMRSYRKTGPLDSCHRRCPIDYNEVYDLLKQEDSRLAVILLNNPYRNGELHRNLAYSDIGVRPSL